MADKKAVTLEQLEIAKNYIDRKDAENIKSAEFVDDTLKFYASTDKSGEAVAEIILPEETFLDGSKTELVSEFSWSITKYPKSTDPELDGKAVLVLAVKAGRTVRYSFVSLDSVVARLVGGDTESTSVSVTDDAVTLNVKVSGLTDNRVVMKDDGLYVGTVDNTPTWTVSTDDEINELFPLSDTPVISADSLGAREVGDVVKIMEDGEPVDFIVVHKGNPDPEMYDASCDGVWLLRKNVLDEGMLWSTIYGNGYEDSDVNNFLNSDYLNSIGKTLRNKINKVRIPYIRGSVLSYSKPLNIEERITNEVFLLSGAEVGITKTYNSTYLPKDGVKLDYFINTGDGGKGRRIAQDSNGNPSCWWLRTANGTANAFRIVLDGDVDSYSIDSEWNGNKLRPAFILPYTAKVDSDGLVIG